ncbi:hypothetical protein STRDD10_01459 [Streptococcus sp. DD10]|uniref:hypothetical protein n=1 Tax=Streptococcus sp. DD10 TaxID=1777878 RepID=UPI0007965986|nr:hypothetical protein [Streptococcus sp. DD10]KXT73540.1 hypothetical protein STRDD10_01459 [Streptococcus sp. DD10]
MREKLFPVVADDEPMLTAMPQMNLYDESDFISNILGDYQDKNFLEWSPISDVLSSREVEAQTKKVQDVFSQQAPRHVRNGLKQEPIGAVKKDAINQSERAREEARRDLKKKKSASYLVKESATTKKHFLASSSSKREQQVPTAPFQKENPGEYSRFTATLRQTDYILAELKPNYQPMENGEDKSRKPKKNTYDFLKKSQVYNKRDDRSPRERKIAQELNLMGLESK